MKTLLTLVSMSLYITMAQAIPLALAIGKIQQKTDKKKIVHYKPLRVLDNEEIEDNRSRQAVAALHTFIAMQHKKIALRESDTTVAIKWHW